MVGGSWGRSARFVVPVAFVLGIALAGLASQAAVSDGTTYVMCVNKATKVVTYPGGGKCAKGATALAVSAPVQTQAGASPTEIAALLYDKVAAATYSVACADALVGGVGVDIALPSAAKSKGFKGAVLASARGIDACEGESVAVLQGSVNYRGFVWAVDADAELALVFTSLPVATLAPSTQEPKVGDFRMAVVSSLVYPEGTLAIGYVNNVNVDSDEELHTLTIGGSQVIPEGAAVDATGGIVSIAHMKPGVVCRSLLDCSASSPWLAWSS